MRNELEDLQQQALEQAKQQVKNMAKESAKKVGQQILHAIAPILPYILIVFAIVVIIAGLYDWGTIEAEASQDMYSASSSSWQQFLEYVATKEGGTKTEDGQYYIVENDSAGNPTVGHGLCLKSSDGYLHTGEFNDYDIDSKELADNWLSGDRSGKVSVEICDSIWETHVKAKYDSIVSKYPDLTTYQHYALTDVVYRRGNTDGFQDKYNSKWSGSDDQFGNYVENDESFSTDTLFEFFWNGGHSLEGVNTRKKDQWVLFKYGYYRPLDEYFIEGSAGDILQVAKELHDAQKSWSYSTTTLCSDIEKAINSPYKTTCCATYVSSILYKAGYETKEQMNSFSFNSSNELKEHFIARGWEQITSYNDLQAGDVVFMDTDEGERDINHVQLYAGDGKWYNAGSNDAIQGDAPKEWNCSSEFMLALRPVPLN